MKKYLTIFLFSISLINKVYGLDYKYILNDKCIQKLFYNSKSFFQNSEIQVIKVAQGIILRYFFEDPITEYYQINKTNLKDIEDFLAKIENPAIIEVHINKFPYGDFVNLKKWEFSTIMANYIEDIITNPRGSIRQDRVNSIGYGEFLPTKNTPNNGGKNLNRIDIIVLCNINGE